MPRLRSIDFARFVLGFMAVSGQSFAGLTLSSPTDYQVVQRTSGNEASIVIAGKLDGVEAPATDLEARLITDGEAGPWQLLPARINNGGFTAALTAPAGGWQRLEVRALAGDQPLGEASVEHVGIGEVFVVAGQSNSANHGEEKQRSMTGLVASFDGARWQVAHDPQPGASGGGGSLIPPFGDAMARTFGVPIGIVACGIGATSVREWLPRGAKFPHPPTIEGNVQRRPDGGWESKGEIYNAFLARLVPLGPRGFRAVLWHQGESDANQRDAVRTLPGALYREFLEKVIVDSRRAIGWEAPWFVAQVSYHVPGDEASPEIRAAQAALWTDRVALEGPDSDALKGDLREAGGQGVHFSGPGLRAHAARWVDKVTPWLEAQTKIKPSADRGPTCSVPPRHPR